MEPFELGSSLYQNVPLGGADDIARHLQSETFSFKLSFDGL